MCRLAPLALAMLIGVLDSVGVRAEEFTIDLKIQAGKQAKPAEVKYPTTNEKAGARTIYRADVKAALTVTWIARSTGKTAVIKDVLIHFFVVKVAKPDQQEVPKLTKEVVVEGALTMDFKAKDKTEGEITFAIPKAGCYLLRVELKGKAVTGEPFAAFDVVVR